MKFRNIMACRAAFAFAMSLFTEADKGIDQPRDTGARGGEPRP